MNSVPALSLQTPSPDAANFLGQCAELGRSIFAQLKSCVQTPIDDQDGQSARMSNLDTASRILKRIQDAYLSAQKTIDRKQNAEHSGGNQQPAPEPGILAMGASASVSSLSVQSMPPNLSESPAPFAQPDLSDLSDTSDLPCSADLPNQSNLPDFPDPQSAPSGSEPSLPSPSEPPQPQMR